MFQKINILLLLSLLCPLFLPQPSNGTENNSQKELLITMNLDNQKFQDVAQLVSKELGYGILVDEKLMQIMTSGTFTNVDVEYFLRHILRGQNIIISTDMNEKTIAIRSFGEKSNLIAIGHENRLTSDAIDPITGKTYSEKRLAYEKSIREHNWNRNDPGVIDPISGKSYVELRSNFEKNLQDSIAIRSNPDSIDPITNQSYTELQRSRQESIQRSKEIRANPNSIDPISGKSYAARDKEFKHNLQVSMDNRLNPGTIDPITGKSYVELRRIREEAFRSLSQ